jgi:putative heme-binding domain-containing protein
VLAFAKQLANDKTAEVRREVAIALRYVKDTKAAAPIWATLANQYDGKDRWYLEALGISADPQADIYFQAWLDQAGDQVSSPSGKNLIWRMRTTKTLPMLSKLISSPQVTDEELKRYFRAFHFHKDEAKNEYLAKFLSLDHPLKKQIGIYTLEQMSEKYLNKSPKLRQQVNALLPSIQGTPEWLTAVKGLKLKTESSALLKAYETHEDKSFAVEAGSVLLDIGGEKMVADAFLKSKGAEYQNWIDRLSWVRRQETAILLMNELKKNKQDFPTKRHLVEALGDSGQGQQLLFDYLQAGKLDEELITTAAIKLSGSWNTNIRQAAPQYLTKATGNVELANLDALAGLEGSASKGEEAFSTYCSTCHQVNGVGTNFGPDLSEIGSKLATKAMFTSIIYPSAGINFGYEGYTIKLKDGKIFQGFIESKTETDLSLRMMGGISQTIKQDEIKSQEPIKKSLMLEGLGQAMGQEKLVDIVSFLQTLKSADQLSAK